MRVVIPVISLDFGGERIIAEIANGLVARGHDVILVVPYGGRIAWPIRAAVTWVPCLTPESIPCGDIILPNFYPTVMPAYYSHKGRCVRLSLAYEPLWIRAPEACASYDLPIPVIVISQWQKSFVQKHRTGPVFLLHPGVDRSVFHPYQRPNDGLKRMLYIRRGRGYAWKGDADFIAAHGMLLRAVPNLHVIVVQSGAVNEDPYPLACELRRGGDDELMGRYYAEADVFVYPSHFESFGLPPLEAMACGTAVIAGDCGGNREYAIHLENCLLVPPGNPAALASTISSLLGDSVTRARLAANGLRTSAEWTWYRTYSEIETILYAILKS